jgi:Ca2+-binding RTX toxin-like protein
MADFTFETMTPAQAAVFDGATDTLAFGDPATNAGNINVTYQTSVDPSGDVQTLGVVLTEQTTGISVTFGPAIAMDAIDDDHIFFAGPSGKLYVGSGGPDGFAGAPWTFPTDASHIYGGPGDDAMIISGQNSVLQGGLGDDTLRGTAAGDTVFGGRGNDSIVVSGGGSRVNGNLGDDTIVGQSQSGGDTLLGGQGDDLIQAGSSGDWLSGDLGHNTLVGGAGHDTFHAGAGQDLVMGFNSSQGDVVKIDAGVQFTVTQVGADAHIDLSNGGEMVLQNTTTSSSNPNWIIQT